MNWIPLHTTLAGDYITLLPLTEAHLPELEVLAKDKRIWEFYPYDCSDTNRFYELFRLALTEKDKGTQFPFVILHNASQKIIGSTRFLDIHEVNKKLEIGWTWLHPDYWATAVNPEAKLLLLTFCFETLKAVRVQLKTNEHNIRSRKAIAKIGAQFEGVLRHDMLQDNGTRRNSAYFSIIDTEWGTVKPALINLFESKRKTQ